MSSPGLLIRTRFAWLRSEYAVVLATWFVVSAIVVAVVHFVDLNPLNSRGAIMPLAAGAIGGVVLVALAWRNNRRLLPAVIAGCYAAWVLFVLLESYHGTPFGDGGLRGDTARLTAAVTRYTTTWKPVDAFVPSIPAQYPPLFPYVLGHLANLFNKPGWTVLGDGMAVTMSLTVVATFILWRRLVSPYAAVVLAALPVFVFTEPRKAYEILVLGVFIPWALSTLWRFGQPGGMHWLPAGLLLGLMVQTYYGFPLFDVVGLVALGFLAWRRSVVRRAYVRHLVLTAVVALVISAWYLGPWAYYALTHGSENVADYAILGGLLGNPLDQSRFTTGFLASVQVVGLIGLIVYRRKHWWAEAILVMVIGAFLYRFLFLVVFFFNGHTGFLYYTSNLVTLLLYTGAVLSAGAAAPTLARRISAMREVLLVAAVVFVAIMMGADWEVWVPTPVGVADKVPHATVGTPNLALQAHAEPLPNGKLPRYDVPPTVLKVGFLPVDKIQAAVSEDLGRSARPATLSFDERLFAYLPWPAYMSVERLASNSLMKWDSRYAEVKRLAAIQDPNAFATASAHTKFGPIDVFVLYHRAAGYAFNNETLFRASQFATGFDVRMLDNHTLLAIRTPSG
jgi:hypothetical protein